MFPTFCSSVQFPSTHLFYQPLRKFCILLGKGKIIILVLLVYRHIFSKDTLHLLPNLVL